MKPSWIKAVIKMLDEENCAREFTQPIFCHGGGHESGEIGEGERQPRSIQHPSKQPPILIRPDDELGVVGHKRHDSDRGGRRKGGTEGDGAKLPHVSSPSCLLPSYVEGCAKPSLPVSMSIKPKEHDLLCHTSLCTNFVPGFYGYKSDNYWNISIIMDHKILRLIR